MKELRDVSLKIKNYKSFGETPQGFDQILPINLIIGKNNAGKSALLDAIGFAVVKQNGIMPNLHNNGNVPEIHISRPMEEATIRQVFPENTSGGPIPGNHFEFGSRWIGARVTTSETFIAESMSLVQMDPAFPDGLSEYGSQLASRASRPFANYKVRRLAADRDIKPEGESGAANLQPDGTGATNTIRFCLHDADANAGHLVKRGLLDALNFVFDGETVFTDINVKVRGGMWEVYLTEQSKHDDIPLSNSGSGLKTIILVLLQLLVIPVAGERAPDASYLFLLEEVENNLHPGLLRNLLRFIREYSEEKDAHFFITTHSSVTIDLFDKDEHSQILHVRHDNTSSSAASIQSFNDKRGILDDLDVRSSDILQSNAIIWVEGPSDRTYINHWIALYSEGELREGEHYQCVFYGGRLLARITADPEKTDNVNILKVNHHAILVMDSDITVPDGRINETKQRMQTEVESVSGLVWVTHGKEIENYLPKEVFETYFGVTTDKRFTARSKIQHYLNSLKKGAGDAFVRNKVLYAEEFIQHFDREKLEANAELYGMIGDVCVKLKAWNGAQPPRV
ncbi:AAA family ATPase [Arthrobacter sp. fls2-241-R2A-200]|uniref:ATP-dependent nuclease n=1 Tax=Arthrobacter sp. fls2-241-R2A-200 TaxID=3040281 RepID=UPI00254D8A92|nr:AAA family ATPase [Arthrobacter sp. fls2-241-R2A-200]